MRARPSPPGLEAWTPRHHGHFTAVSTRRKSAQCAGRAGCSSMLHLHDAKKISTVVCACRCSVHDHRTSAALQPSRQPRRTRLLHCTFPLRQKRYKESQRCMRQSSLWKPQRRQRKTNVDPNRSRQLQTTTDPQCFFQVHLLFLDRTPKKLTPKVTLTRHRGLDVIKERVYEKPSGLVGDVSARDL